LKNQRKATKEDEKCQYNQDVHEEEWQFSQDTHEEEWQDDQDTDQRSSNEESSLLNGAVDGKSYFE
jgi:hypothetical protein